MSQNSPASTIRYRFGMAPDRELSSEPSFSQVISELNAADGAVFAASVLIPSFYGYRLRHHSPSNMFFKFALGTSLLAGSIYAYSRSYARLTGISIPTPQRQ